MPIVVSTPAKNLEKLQNLILCVAAKAPDIGITKLEKLLYLVDFEAIKELGKSISEDAYRNFQWGPVPIHFIPAHDNLIAQGKLQERKIKLQSGRDFTELTPHAECDQNSFTRDEWRIIEAVLNEYGHKSAADLVTLTHAELPWKLTERNEEIPEFLAHYRGYKKPSKEEIDRLTADPDYLRSVASQLTKEPA